MHVLLQPLRYALGLVLNGCVHWRSLKCAQRHRRLCSVAETSASARTPTATPPPPSPRPVAVGSEHLPVRRTERRRASSEMLLELGDQSVRRPAGR